VSSPINLSSFAAGDYTFTYTVSPADENSDCESDYTEVTITISPQPVVTIVMPPIDCFAEEGSVAVTSSTDGLEFQLDGGDWFTYSGPIDVAPGAHTLVARDAVTLCESEDVPFTISPLPDSPVTPTLDAIQPTCEVPTGTIIVTSRTDLQFFVALVEDLPFIDPLYVDYPMGGFSGLAPGEYAVFALSADGCESGMATITLMEPECPEYEGCTLGYWKNHTDRWCDEYQTCTEYGLVFENAPDELATLTLLEVLNLGGGGIYNLGRQSVAALLNACSDGVDYELETTADVIAYVNANFWDAGNAGSYLDMLNNAGCTMGGSKATTAPSEGCDEEVDSGKGNNGNNGKGNNGKAKVSSSIAVYPMPFKETVNLQYDIDYSSDVTIEIYDMRGKHLRTYSDKNISKGKGTTLSVDFAVQANQMYILKIKTDRETIVKQIVSSKK
ncbi:MAG: T9SS type A sorting domain-containing protein, partial [Salinimicrobium sediminis]|nr:T9SS type A sorting domain-containing protein [Salinimicrobium sediminis]